MAVYNCPELGCNVYFDQDLDDLVPMAINHAFGSHGKNIDRDAVVGTVRGEAQVEATVQQEPVPVEKPTTVRRKRKKRNKRRKQQVKVESTVEIEPKGEVEVETGNKISDWWKKKE